MGVAVARDREEVLEFLGDGAAPVYSSVVFGVGLTICGRYRRIGGRRGDWLQHWRLGVVIVEGGHGVHRRRVGWRWRARLRGRNRRGALRLFSEQGHGAGAGAGAAFPALDSGNDEERGGEAAKVPRLVRLLWRSGQADDRDGVRLGDLCRSLFAASVQVNKDA
ncbi:hypothetical protein PICMEDRAFT_85216 [Pichia membranifaciens NRRL Y-2026]|uniref:Uncharacterized protein n=1 Tax=Pichia membranifaciens NRRL Y-2026 TaxID=763406 RepID=A0A1E3NSJ8_9ASCO|nr:hypothetical protein PICMEDRAFT_85216 [Pichia membranifaciens NRRL Y-2026]ODQ48648.1 hypothetical protein PICMEDRAFT_85216 [Pichia membranifaciens NRRL Y-2026]